METNFLEYYFNEFMYLQNPPLRRDKFLKLCKKYGFNISKRDLEIYEEKGIFKPIFCTKNQKDPYYPDDEYMYFEFNVNFKESLIENYNKGNIYLPSEDKFNESNNLENDSISFYYSNFQLEQIIEIHNCFQMPRNMLINSKKWDEEGNYIDFYLDMFKEKSKYYDNKTRFLINIQRFYYPLAMSDFKIFRFKGGDNDWHKDKKNFKTVPILKRYNFTPKNIIDFMERYLSQIEDLLGIKWKSQYWISFFENLNLDYKNDLSNQFGLIIHNLSIAIMLKHFLRDYSKETGEKIFSLNFPEFLNNENKYDKLYYLVNRFKLNYQQTVSVFVEGKSEELILNKLFKWYCGGSLEHYGIQIINFEGVDKLISNYDDMNKLKHMIYDIKKETNGDAFKWSSNKHSKFNSLIKNLEDLDLILSNWSSYISYNLQKWYIIPFFVSDNEGNIQKFLSHDKIIRFDGKNYNIPKDWQYIWGISNNNYPFKGKDLELSNFSDLEIATVLKEFINKDISVSNVAVIRNKGLGIKQIQNSKYKDLIGQKKIDIVEKLFDNLIKNYEKNNDSELFNRPIFKLLDKLYDLKSLNKYPMDKNHKERLNDELLFILTEDN